MVRPAKRDLLPVRQRQLAPAELRYLRSQSAALRKSGRRALRGGFWIGLSLIAALWLWTILVSDTPLIVITGFWLIVGGAILVLMQLSARRDAAHLSATANRFESAIRRNLADSYDVCATRYVQFEEVEDEGACYAFELESGQIVFLQGQQYYESAGFPCLDFSLVMPLDEQGGRVHEFLEKRSLRASPSRIIPAAEKDRLIFPDDLVRVDGPLDTIEERLQRR